MMWEKISALACALFFLVLAISGCGGEKDTEAPAPVQDFYAPTIQIQTPTSDDSFLTQDSTITIGGVASDDIAITKVDWAVDTGGSGDATGTMNWSASGIPLVVGDNAITVTASDASGKSTSDTLIVTLNEYIAFLGRPEPTPSGFFAGTPTEAIVTISIAPNPNLVQSSVHLLEVDGSNNLINDLGRMYDDGDLAHADEIKGDGVFSYIGTFNSDTPDEIRLRVSATSIEASGDIDANSAISSIFAVAVISEASANAAVAAQEAGEDQYNTFADDNSPNEAKQLTIEWLETQPNVINAKITESRDIWIDYTEGITGMILFAKEGEEGGGPDIPGVSGSNVPPHNQPIGLHPPGGTSSATDPNAVLSNKVLLYAPNWTQFNDWGTEFLDNINTILGNADCPEFDVDYKKNTNADLSVWNDMSDYGLIVIHTHGSVKDGQVLFLSGEEYISASDHKIDWALGRLTTATMHGKTFWIVLPGYISSRTATLPKSIVYNGSCESSRNNSMSNAFISKGAQTYFGFSQTVYSVFDRDMANALFPKLIDDLKTTGEAFVPNQHDAHEAKPAYFTMVGNDKAHFRSSLVNGDFEEGKLTGWIKTGDGRIITGLSSIAPLQGSYMGIISTGLGFTTSVGELSQSFCVGADDTLLTMKWNFLSEEFDEYVGSQYQDYFVVKLVESNGIEHELLHETIDSIWSGSTMTHVSPGIVFDKGDVWENGWKTETWDIRGYRGKSLTLVLAAGDVGDSYYDTAILLDAINILK